MLEITCVFLCVCLGLSMPGALASFGMGPGGMAATRLGLQALGGGGGQAGVLLVSNLNPEVRTVTTHTLFLSPTSTPVYILSLSYKHTIVNFSSEPFKWVCLHGLELTVFCYLPFHGFLFVYS